jgi:hypothetical protein
VLEALGLRVIQLLPLRLRPTPDSDAPLELGTEVHRGARGPRMRIASQDAVAEGRARGGGDCHASGQPVGSALGVGSLLAPPRPCGSKFLAVWWWWWWQVRRAGVVVAGEWTSA